MQQHSRRGITIIAGMYLKRDPKGGVLGDLGHYETMNERG